MAFVAAAGAASAAADAAAASSPPSQAGGGPAQPPTFVAKPGDRVDGPAQFMALARALEARNADVPAREPRRQLRLMTFNVHYFQDGVCKDNVSGVLDIVRRIDPDVAVFQEVPVAMAPERPAAFDEGMRALGFRHVVRACGLAPWDLGNALYSKLPFRPGSTWAARFEEPNDKRFYASAVLDLPGGRGLRVTGTHLEVYFKCSREAQAEELVRRHAKEPDLEHVILADFNAWLDSPTLQTLLSAGYQEAFGALGWQRPNYTCWTGTAIDFALLRLRQTSVVGAYVLHTAVSDHLPVIVDLRTH